jgi:hypothetical protein
MDCFVSKIKAKEIHITSLEDQNKKAFLSVINEDKFL